MYQFSEVDMEKNDLLKHIAETGYNVGFGAKKHFATYDIVAKTPGLISFSSLAFGVYALAFDGLSTKLLSATFVVLGIIGLYISFYDGNKEKYEQSGSKLTQLFNQLKKLYSKVKSDQTGQLIQYETELKAIEDEYYQNCVSKQILLSDWYAHYKFFWQHQIEWIDEQKSFRFLRDKVPLSLSFFVIILSVVFVINFFDAVEFACKLATSSDGEG
jgi:hypothetical protein